MCACTLWTYWRWYGLLFALDWTVNVADKKQGGTEPNRAKHEEETIANTGHVAKEKGGLHEAWHIWSCIVVIQAIAINEQSSWSTTKERPDQHQIQRGECRIMNQAIRYPFKTRHFRKHKENSCNGWKKSKLGDRYIRKIHNRNPMMKKLHCDLNISSNLNNISRVKT